MAIKKNKKQKKLFYTPFGFVLIWNNILNVRNVWGVIKLYKNW